MEFIKNKQFINEHHKKTVNNITFVVSHFNAYSEKLTLNKISTETFVTNYQLLKWQLS